MRRLCLDFVASPPEPPLLEDRLHDADLPVHPAGWPGAVLGQSSGSPLPGHRAGLGGGFLEDPGLGGGCIPRPALGDGGVGASTAYPHGPPAGRAQGAARASVAPPAIVDGHARRLAQQLHHAPLEAHRVEDEQHEDVDEDERHDTIDRVLEHAHLLTESCCRVARSCE
jgi:hypothetical protein